MLCQSREKRTQLATTFWFSATHDSSVKLEPQILCDERESNLFVMAYEVPKERSMSGVAVGVIDKPGVFEGR